MTGKERALAALRFEPTDRAPVSGGLVGNADFLAEAAGVSDFWKSPRATAFEAYRRLGCDVILGPNLPKDPATTTRDANGRDTNFTRSGQKPWLTTPEAVADFAKTFPSPDEVRGSFDAEEAYREYLKLMREGQRDAGDCLFIPSSNLGIPYLPTCSGEFDYMAWLMACALYPDELEVMFRCWGEQARLRYEAIAEATVENDLLHVVWTGTDLCDRRGPVLSPALLDRLYFPQLEHAIAPLKDAGLKIIWHADANYVRLLPRLLSLGIDGFQGFYEEEGGMRLADLAAARSRDGNPLILIGSVSTVNVLPTGSVADVEREVERCVDATWGRCPLILAPSSGIGPEVPKENIRAMFEHGVSYVPREKGR
jgi:hypothetical protein